MELYLLILHKKMKFIMLLTLLIATACNEGATKNASVQKNVENIEVTGENLVSDYQCVAKVNGLVCKMGCGGAIRKGLKELNGVNRVVIDFDENREEQIVTVFYNSKKQNEKNIYAKLEKVNNGQFTAGDTKSEPFQNPS